MTRPATGLLERRYRRWLLAYPAGYRRERGDELLGTLLDVAGPGRRHPAVREVAALVRSGVAQRIRLQVRRWRGAWSGERRGRSALVLGAVWASVMTVSVAVAPLTLGYSCADPQWSGMLLDCEPRVGFLLSHHGLWGYLWLLPPWLLAQVAVLVRRPPVAVVCAVALTLVVVATANSLGTYYLPSLLACWLGAVWVKDPGMPDVVGATGIPDLPGPPRVR